jgi:dipeptidyl aminopeptidase/acylaminoacyl peptidase
VIQWGPQDKVEVADWTADGKSLWVTSNLGQDTMGLVKVDLESGQQTVTVSEPETDVWRPLLNPLTREIEAVAFRRERVRWSGLNAKIAADLKYLQQSVRGDFLIVNADRDWETWVVSCSGDVRPTDYYLYDRRAKKLKHLFNAWPELAKYTVAPMKPVMIKSRDGLELTSYLTLPVGVKPKNLPLVLLVHGGPFIRDAWGYNAEVQWLANRGYAVLQVNYRGSTGFGKKFENAGHRQSGAKMHDDLLDAVRWAIQEGIADPKRVAIYGSSYGGYAALVGASFTPDVFACAISLCGVSNLVSFLKSVPPAYEQFKKQYTVWYGDVEKEEEFLKSRSPLFKADRIRIPLFIAQGANDPLVKRAESEQIVEAVRKMGKEVEYLLFPDEGHGLGRPDNRLKFYAAMEAFLAKHLGGGRVEPASRQVIPE